MLDDCLDVEFDNFNVQSIFSDRTRTEKLNSLTDIESISNDEAKDIVFKVLGFPIQGLCRY